MIIRSNYKFVDRNLRKTVEDFCQNCSTCIKNKSRFDRGLGKLPKIGPAQQPFDFISIDTMSGFTGNLEARYLHLAVDHLSRYVWYLCSETTKTEDINLMELVLKDGSPKRILSDNHQCLTSKELTTFAHSKKITLILVPQDSAGTNGLIERVGQTITNKVRCPYNENNREYK